MRRYSLATGVLASLFLTALLTFHRLRAEPAPDGTWTANADLANKTVLSMDGLGAMQGVSFHDGTPWNAEAAKSDEPFRRIPQVHSVLFRRSGAVYRSLKSRTC